MSSGKAVIILTAERPSDNLFFRFIDYRSSISFDFDILSVRYDVARMGSLMRIPVCVMKHRNKKQKQEVRTFSAEKFFPLILVLITSVLFVIKVVGPSNLLDNDQERPAAYTLDVTANHHWVCQTDQTGDITSKPPLYTWLAAVSTLTLGKGKINLVTLYLPCFLSILGCAFLIYLLGRPVLGWQASAFGAMVLVISPMGMKMVALARTDPLFAFTITLAAVLGYNAWSKGKGWTWFWLAAALSALTKGPLGLLLASGGFLSYFWNKKTLLEQPQIIISWRWLLGIILFLIPTLGWFLLAYHVEGEALINKMIKSELVGHAVSSHYGIPGQGFVLAPLYLISRFLPWSLLGLAECVLIFRKPAENPKERRLERFLLVWIIAGAVILGMGTHQRGDLILPLVPPLSLLAGRFILRWLPVKLKENPVYFLRTVGFTGALGLALVMTYNQCIFSKQKVTYRTKAVEKIASNIIEAKYDLNQLHHYKTPFALQFFLNTMTLETQPEEVALLMRSDTPCLLTVRNLEEFEKLLGEDPPSYRIAYRWYLDDEPIMYLIANDASARNVSSLTSHTRRFKSSTIHTE